MILIIVLLALGTIQVLGAESPFHRDSLFLRWHNWLRLQKLPWPGKSGKWFEILVIIGLPVATVAVMTALLDDYLVYPLALLVLLYSLGRGEFATHLDNYKHACADNSWGAAVEAARQQGIHVDVVAESDWSTLNQRVLEGVAYQGFERLFAVLFWFVLFGPAGALMYRLSALFQQNWPAPASDKWLWAIEWPAARLLGVSFAITGNFVGCINRWQVYLLSQACPTPLILRETVLGALSVDDELVESCDCTHREIAALRRLYARTLWFWIAALAIWTIL